MSGTPPPRPPRMLSRPAHGRPLPSTIRLPTRFGPASFGAAATSIPCYASLRPTATSRLFSSALRRVSRRRSWMARSRFPGRPGRTLRPTRSIASRTAARGPRSRRVLRPALSRTRRSLAATPTSTASRRCPRPATSFPRPSAPPISPPGRRCGGTSPT